MAFLDLASPRDIDMQLKDVTLLLNLWTVLECYRGKKPGNERTAFAAGTGHDRGSVAGDDRLAWGSTGVDATLESLQMQKVCRDRGGQLFLSEPET